MYRNLKDGISLLHYVSKLQDNPLLSVQEEQDVLRIIIEIPSELHKSWIDHIIQKSCNMTQWDHQDIFHNILTRHVLTWVS